ncbi:SAM-dependent methyltransferase [Mycolicibacterium tusciae]|uniref:SAM-dependent methyltransferase n=2 Tax=Mycolicibacterium tusciae TaxID=75922 RepID=A0A1X0JEI9_9MYCO|nr:SAM-dependent methyltransferase [Mycolicibacterium tusciae]
MDRLTYHPIVWKLGYKTQKRSYRTITRRYGADDVVFLNYGYEENPPVAISLDAADEPDRFPIQLYHRTATQADDLSGAQVLEVGCGHGGGASYLTRTLRPAGYKAMDLNPTGIDFCRRRHRLPGLEFVLGDAENLPFPDQTFDAVINIESSIHYPDFRRFLAEVARVLRPGGHLLYADGRFAPHVPDWEAALAGAPMRMVSDRVINAEILRGMDRNSQRWQELLDRHRSMLARATCQFVQGSKVYQAIESGEFSYRMYRFDV